MRLCLRFVNNRAICQEVMKVVVSTRQVLVALCNSFSTHFVAVHAAKLMHYIAYRFPMNLLELFRLQFVAIGECL